jgi:proteasome accessory factor A
LSTKGRAIDQIVGWGSYRGERPIYVFRHWLEQLCDPSMHTFQATVALWKRRQRLQIGLSDSNAADWAEYLKVGATSLVLDLIEAGGGEGLPRLKRPLAALRRIGGDWNLVVDVPTDRGPMSALRIQTAYYEACRRFVEAHPHGHDAEARKVLRVWKASLDAAAAFRRDATAIEPALGRLDWLTKRWMLDQLSADASWETRKKVDLRYHELTAEGYFRRLSEAIPAAWLADEAAVSRAYRLPPRDSPAGRRGYLVREFGGCDDSLRVSWSQVVIGHGRHRRVVDLHDDR